MSHFRNNYGDQNIYIAGTQLRGVQSFNGGFEIPYEPIKVAGIGYLDHTINSNLEGNFNVNRFVVSTGDPLTGLFTKSISGHLNYGTGRNALRLAFRNGYINSYSSSCQVGGVPNLDFGLIVYGDMGRNVPTVDEKNVGDETILVARHGDISLLNVSGHKTNLIQSYSYSINIPRKPIYTLGSGVEPGLYNIDYPIVVDLAFNMYVDDFETQNMHDLLCDQPKSDICILLSGCGGSEKIRGFSAPCPLFLGVEQTSSVDKLLSVDIKYRSYINDINEVAGLVQGDRCGLLTQECLGEDYL